MVAGVADVNVAAEGPGAVDGDESGGFEFTGRRACVAGFASIWVRGADVAPAARIDVLPKHQDEFARGAELLDAVVSGVGDVTSCCEAPEELSTATSAGFESG